MPRDNTDLDPIPIYKWSTFFLFIGLSSEMYFSLFIENSLPSLLGL